MEFTGGADEVLKRARRSYADGDFRWVVQVVNHVIFADPGDIAARDLQADALEQLGYGSENGTWRNFYQRVDHALVLVVDAFQVVARAHPASAVRLDEGHDRVTGRPGSHAAARDNLVEAHRLGIRVRVKIVDVLEGQRVEEARAELEGLGITQVHIGRLRGVGNAAAGGGLPSTSELCGRCAHGVAAVLPNDDSQGGGGTCGPAADVAPLPAG